MTLFRIWLAVIILALGTYSLLVVSAHGLNFLPAFLGDIAKYGWAGQFNFDFASVISGCLFLGSSCGNSLYSILDLLFVILITSLAN